MNYELVSRQLPVDLSQSKIDDITMQEQCKKYKIDYTHNVLNKDFVMAIAQKESNMDPTAIGDTNLIHKAYGIMQVRKPAMDDVNKAYGTDYTESDLMELNPQAIATS